MKVVTLFMCFFMTWNQGCAFVVPDDENYEEKCVVEELSLIKDSGGGDKRSHLHFSMFGKPYSFNLKPADSIFAPYFQVLDEEILNENKYKRNYLKFQESEKLDGSFYIDEDGRGSFYIEHENDEIKMNGFADDYIGFWNSNGHNLAAKTRVKRRKVDNKSTTRRAATTRSSCRKNVTRTATIELLVFLDPIVTKKLKKKKTDIKKYSGIFWNAVQNKYKVFKNPEVKFTLSGVIALDKMDWANKTYIAPKKIDADKFLDEFGYWLYEEHDKFPKFDVAALHTGLDMYSVDETGNIENNLIGMAFYDGVCYTDEDEEQYQGALLFEDFYAPLYTSANTAAHEIAHLLNVDHDTPEECGNNSMMASDDEEISPSVMEFTECSIKVIQEALESNSTDCLYDTSEPKLPIDLEMPVMTRSHICKTAYGSKYDAVKLEFYENADVSESEVCIYVVCGNKNRSVIKWLSWVPEKTICGIDKVCVNGNCTNI